MYLLTALCSYVNWFQVDAFHARTKVKQVDNCTAHELSTLTYRPDVRAVLIHDDKCLIGIVFLDICKNNGLEMHYMATCREMDISKK